MALILRGRRLSGLSLSAMAVFGFFVVGYRAMVLGCETRSFPVASLWASQIGRAVYDVGASQGSASVPAAFIPTQHQTSVMNQPGKARIVPSKVHTVICKLTEKHQEITNHIIMPRKYPTSHLDDWLNDIFTQPRRMQLVSGVLQPARLFILSSAAFLRLFSHHSFNSSSTPWLFPISTARVHTCTKHCKAPNTSG
jgi:hypothetical protein